MQNLSPALIGLPQFGHTIMIACLIGIPLYRLPFPRSLPNECGQT